MNYIELDEADIDVLVIATEYHIQESYPQYERPLPPRDEIKEVLDFTEAFFTKVCKVLHVDKEELI